MMDELKAAKRKAGQIRFSDDAPVKGKIPVGVIDAAKSFHFANALNISREVTPSLHRGWMEALDNLLVPRQAATAFVYPSTDMQASCIPDDNGCVICFSSALIDIMDGEEFKFVAGHELGHFLLGHCSPENSGDLARGRAQEISCDRIGLVACGGELNTAVKAMIKMMSGLTEAHIRSDVGVFLSQLRKTSGASSNRADTHPPVLVRCRALLWFSMSGYFSDRSGESAAGQLPALDKKIQQDLSKHVGSPANDAKKKVKMWTAICDIVRDNVFDKKEQQRFAAAFGADKLETLKKFLASASNPKSAAAKKLQEAKEALNSLK